MKHAGLAELLQAFDAAEFRERVPHLCKGYPKSWPYDVRDRISKAENVWRKTAGNITDRGIVTACVESEGAIWCVLRIYFVHVREETESTEAKRPEGARPKSASGGGGIKPSGPVARNFSPSLCGNGW